MPLAVRTSILLCNILLLQWPIGTHAATIDIFPGDSFEDAVESLQPGDRLIVHEGTYVDSGRISIGVVATAQFPVIIESAAGEQRPLITRRAGDPEQNTINIEGAQYLTIRGLEISSNGGDGINMNSGPSYITLEDLFIHDISVGINFRSNMHHITVSRNHITRTNDTGEGMYVGCNYAECVVRDSLIENNWIHDTNAASQGDGIEIKRGSHSNIIRDNVIYDTNWPCILLYGTEGQPRNIVEGNVLWDCGEAAIQVAADTIIRNNILLDSPDEGLISQSHQGVTPGNLTIAHNTIVTGGTCLGFRDWNNRPDIVFSNNAVYCSSNSYSIGGINGVVVTGNVFEPGTDSLPASGFTTGRSEAADFVAAGNRNVYPTVDSPLLGAGDSARSVLHDFNGTPRNSGVDAGAYTWTDAQNPGWAIKPGFKESGQTTPNPVKPNPPSDLLAQ